MTIGVPKEIKQKENRVALLPSAAWQLVQRGQRVLVEKGAEAGAGYAGPSTRRPVARSWPTRRACSLRPSSLGWPLNERRQLGLARRANAPEHRRLGADVIRAIAIRHGMITIE
jgi:hypothetical protein